MVSKALMSSHLEIDLFGPALEAVSKTLRKELDPIWNIHVSTVHISNYEKGCETIC
jgi:hypothetical protein